MVDVFEEVDEQFRSEQFKTTALRYLPWIGAGLVAGLVVAFAIWGYRQHLETGQEKASEAYSAALVSLVQKDNDKAFQQFQTAADASTPAYRTLALMQQGAIRLDQKRTPEAVALFDQAAAAAPNLILGDAARLKAAYALMDTASPTEIEARLKPLTDSKRPYAPLAREAVAVTELATGHTADARSDFVVLSLLSTAPEDVRTRAKAAITLIDDGVTGDLAAAAKASLSAPVPVPPSPGAGADAGASADQAAQGAAAQ